MSAHTASGEGITIGDMLVEIDERLGSRPEPEILTLTEKKGFVSQRERFKKRLATEDTSEYKFLELNDLAFNPYLLWAGAIAQNVEWEKAIVSPAYPTFRIKKGYSPRFVKYLLCSKYLLPQYGSISHGSVPRRRRAAVDDFLALEIPKQPPTQEQERIVALLDEADALRKLRAEADGRTSALIPALFHEMFGRKALPIQELGELIVKGPQNGLYKHSSLYGEGTPILRIDAFYDGQVEDLNSLKRVRTTSEELATYGLQENDVVLNRVNSVEYLGKSALIPALSEGVVFESNMMRFALREKEIDPTYAIQFLQTPQAKQQILSRAKHSINQSSVNQDDVKSLRIPIPPLGLQKQFAEWVRKIRDLESKQADSRERLNGLFQSMLHRAFEGEL